VPPAPAEAPALPAPEISEAERRANLTRLSGLVREFRDKGRAS
jgi:hypothetical protein